MAESPALNDDFRDILTLLVEERAAFLVVGAHAMAVHGVPRATGDLDLFVEPDPENARRVQAALLRFGAPVEEHGLSPADLERSGTAYQIGLPPRRVDILTSIDGVTFREAWSTRTEVLLDDLTIPLIGRDALIRNKRASGRPKDLVDVGILESDRD